MDRQRSWEDPNGKTVEVLAKALEVHLDTLISGNIDIYASSDFKNGLDLVGLVVHASLLLNLCEVDTRGGYFRQKDMKDALMLALSNKSRAEEFHALIAGKQQDMDSAVQLTSYKVRVMLSHLRERHDNLKTDPPEELMPIFNLFQQNKDGQCSKRATH